MGLNIQHWLLRQMNSHDSLDAVAVTVKLAIRQFGNKKVARELRRFATCIEQNGELPGLEFRNLSARGKTRR